MSILCAMIYLMNISYRVRKTKTERHTFLSTSGKKNLQCDKNGADSDSDTNDNLDEVRG